jgi:serine/threonine-protein kinase RsbW
MSSAEQNPETFPDEATLVVINDPAAIDQAQAQVVSVIEKHQYPRASVFAIRLSLHEAMSNAFRHGHSRLPPQVPVKISYNVMNDRVLLAVEDQGPGFNPGSVPDPTLQENLERGSGRGLLLIRAYMASAEYNQKGNRLEMVYERPAE